MLEYITDKLDASDSVATVFIDLRKAFTVDTVHHDILLKKLENYGFKGKSHYLLRNYFANRRQYVQLETSFVDAYSNSNYGETGCPSGSFLNSTAKIRSSMQDIICGVPQGSVLGPLLFYYFY